MCFEHMKSIPSRLRFNFCEGVEIHQWKILLRGEQCAGTDMINAKKLGRTHQTCREHRSSNIMLVKVTFELGKQNKEFISLRGRGWRTKCHTTDCTHNTF